VKFEEMKLAVWRAGGGGALLASGDKLFNHLYAALYFNSRAHFAFLPFSTCVSVSLINQWDSCETITSTPKHQHLVMLLSSCLWCCKVSSAMTEESRVL